MTDSRYWSKDFTTEFIELYKSHPCLWKIRSKEYTNKNLKNQAYEKLVRLCKKVHPEATRDFVVKKIQSLRGSFRKEAKKMIESRRNGSSPDDIYVSSLWYFDLLLFTIDQELPTNSIASNSNELLNEDQEQEMQVEVLLQDTTSSTEMAENFENETTDEVNIKFSILTHIRYIDVYYLHLDVVYENTIYTGTIFMSCTHLPKTK